MVDYQWRPATQADVGSVARFYNDKSVPVNGILSSISKDPAGKYVYVCVPNSCVAFGDNAFDHCDIQYNADEEP